MTAVATASGPAGVLTTLALAVTFLAVMFGVVRPVLARLPDLPIWTVLVVALGAAWTAEVIGVHAIIGAFVAGVVMPRRPEWARRTDERLDTVVRTLLLPVFFAVAGMATRIDRLTGAALLLAAAVILVATLGKLGAGAVAARAAGESWSDATTLGILLNTRGVTELVIASLGLQLGIIDPIVYTVLVVMAVVTTVSTTPLLGVVRRASAPAPGCSRRADRSRSTRIVVARSSSASAEMSDRPTPPVVEAPRHGGGARGSRSPGADDAAASAPRRPRTCTSAAASGGGPTCRDMKSGPCTVR